MLRPSYSELMDSIKQEDKLDGRITSRYTVVLAAAKRARQITDGANPLTYAPTDRAVSIAVKEMSEGKLRVRVQSDLLDGKYERMLKDQYKYRGMVALSKDDLREDLKDNYSDAYTPSTEDDDSDVELFHEDSFNNENDSIEEKDDFDIYGDDEEPDENDADGMDE